MPRKKPAAAETDTNWKKLNSSKKSPAKKPTAKVSAKTSELKYSKDASKFPYETFPIRLDHLDGKDKKTCWFQCEDHFIKYITRYKLTQYEAITNDMAIVGKSDRRKSTQKRPNRRSGSNS